MRNTKLIALVLVLVMIVGALAACGDKKPEGTSANPDETVGATQQPLTEVPVDPADAVEHKDYTSVYDMIGSKVTIDMVEERDGVAYVTVDGKEYELGMDFLSMAMVYRTAVPEGSKYKTSEEIFNQWWKLYIQRWNYMVPEVPLYSNQYFDLYNAKIQNFVTTPYWDSADAIIAATVKAGEDNSVILGSATELGGLFRNSSWGKNSPAASDLAVQNLVSGHATVMTDKSGSLVWNTKALNGTPTSVVNADGTLTYTIKIAEGLVFSDGSAITAKNYIAGILANSTAVGVEAGGSGNSGMTLIGFDAFKAYTGANDGAAVEGEEYKASKWFSGIKLLDDYTFSVTFTPDYASYYFAMNYAAYSPDPLALYLGAAGDIVVNDDKTVGLNDAFYAKETKDGKDSYKVAAEIVANLKWDSALPYSGPYTVSNYDESTQIATLKLNPKYIGDDARGKASIETITYIEVVAETQMDMFKTGKVDVIEGITGGKETEAALAVVKADPSKYAETHYDRAGYGKLAFRCDLGPTAFAEVRQAIMHTINRNEFSQNFTGGYGTVVHGPYYTGYSAYKAVEKDILLNKYDYSVDSAIAVLEEGGWVYNADGTTYDAAKGGIRYKKLSGYELTLNNINFKSVDSKYKTVKLSDGNYYMPLAINWVGTQPNDVTDQLLTAWQTAPASTEKIGMAITYTTGEFMQAVYGDYCQYEAYGWNGTASCNAVNFATGFNSAIYDFSFNWTISPDMYADYSNNYLMDEADFWENY